MRQTPRQLMARKSSLHAGLKECLQVEKKDPDVNLNLQERMKNAINGKSMGTYKRLSFLSSLKVYCL